MKLAVAAALALLTAPAYAQTQPVDATTLAQALEDTAWVGIAAHNMRVAPDLKKLARVIESETKRTLFDILGQPDPCSGGGPYSEEKNQCLISVGVGALKLMEHGTHDIAIGRCSGASLASNESDDLLIGDYTTAPKGKNGFVNLQNQLCWWRESGEETKCPTPEPGCELTIEGPKQ